MIVFFVFRNLFKLVFYYVIHINMSSANDDFTFGYSLHSCSYPESVYLFIYVFINLVERTYPPVCFIKQAEAVIKGKQ